MIILGLGSNLPSSFGNRFQNIELAIIHLNNLGIYVKKKSNYYETPSYPNKKDPKFINVVVKIEAKIKPEDLAASLISIEEKLERKRKKKNEPRTCDIDIIDFNQQILDFKYKNFDFNVPHYKLSDRSFVLYPLKEIDPAWKHPKTNEVIDVLIKKLSEEDKNSILKVEKP